MNGHSFIPAPTCNIKACSHAQGHRYRSFTITVGPTSRRSTDCHSQNDKVAFLHSEPIWTVY
jgi:hypothetical protein